MQNLLASSSHSNARRASRRAVALRCQVVRERGFRLIADRSCDLSTDGMRVEGLLADVEVGERLLVSFCGTETGVWFDLDARVTRVLAGRRQGELAPSVGIAFDNQDALGRLMLRGALGRFPLTVPRRKPKRAAALVARGVQ